MDRHPGRGRDESFHALHGAFGGALVRHRFNRTRYFFARSLRRPHLARSRHCRRHSFGDCGTSIGAVAGYYSGWVDRFLSGYLFNVFLAFPGLLLAIALVAFLGAGLNKLIFALCIIGWVGYARLIRAQVLKVREYDFVQAARALGAGDFRILFVHILPNAIQPLIVQASLGMAGAVLAEASLSFLGLGVPPPAPSWGVMIEEARDLSTLQAAPHALIFPGLAIALTVLAFNFIGDGLREYLDPRQRRR